MRLNSATKLHSEWFLPDLTYNFRFNNSLFNIIFVELIHAWKVRSEAILFSNLIMYPANISGSNLTRTGIKYPSSTLKKFPGFARESFFQNVWGFPIALGNFVEKMYNPHKAVHCEIYVLLCMCTSHFFVVNTYFLHNKLSGS